VKNKWFALLLLVVGLVGVVAAEDRLQTTPGSDLIGNEMVRFPTEVIGYESNGARQLGVLIGDTIFVGASAWDDQHNAGAARQITYQPGDQWLAQLVYTKLSGGMVSDPRHIRAIRVREDEFGELETWPNPSIQVDSQHRSGYVGMVYSVTAETPLLVYHGAETDISDYLSIAAMKDFLDPSTFNEYTVPDVFPESHLWPRSIAGQDGYLHMVSHGQRALNTDPLDLSYMRYSIDDQTLTLLPATPDDNPILITDDAMNISADIAVTNDGQTVAIGAVVSRHSTIGERWGGLTATQVNNDVYVYLSHDGGITWDPNDRIDVTQFIGPDDEIPNDTMRAYADISLEFTTQARLRAAFTAAHGNPVTGFSLNESRIYHYLEDEDGHEWWTQIHFQPDPGYPPEIWGRTADHPSLYFDSLTGILWCLFRAFDGGEHDYSEDTGIGNGDLFVSASPPGTYNGLLWTLPVNITSTNWDDPGGAPLGDCESELDASIAINSNGPYLHISYLLDIQAGTSVANPAEGVITNNPYVYHRVLKQDLMREFEIAGEWVVNYPMHHDSTGFWQDPGNWDWYEYGGFFTGFRNPLPVTLTLDEIDFSIPPEGGTGTFSATINSLSPQSFAGVDFWTMVTTPIGNVVGPAFDTTFTIEAMGTWTADTLYQYIPESAPGGTYYVTGHIGYFPISYEQDAIQLFKFGAVTDDLQMSLDPRDWLGYGEFHKVSADDSSEEELLNSGIPSDFSMSAAYPNPFNPETSISVNLHRSAELTVDVYNVTGRLVATLAQGKRSAGVHKLTFDGSNLSSGLYFIQATVEGQPAGIQKVTLLK
jgi:Secretion system C-terminal sorting domain